ncbi:hypothetical protein V6Z11_D10G195400 [Gossypium hirsutum]
MLLRFGRYRSLEVKIMKRLGIFRQFNFCCIAVV